MDPEITDPYARLLAHPIFRAVDDLPRLRRFMESHVYAVWDFMSLVKRLQRDLTCVRLPWLPPADPTAARLINQIVTAEESDVGPDGKPVSHLELYLGAMDEVGADAASFRLFLAEMHEHGSVAEAFSAACAPEHVRRFVRATLRCAEHAPTEEVLAAFLYGRESPIPAMFRRLAGTLRERVAAPRFADYLDRHIQLDAEAHGPAAARIAATLIGGDALKRRRALRAARDAIECRIRFFDGVLDSLARAEAA